ncbi:MAG TPA: hotdog domain-containing protein [Acidimicrobiales bacterium]
MSVSGGGWKMAPPERGFLPSTIAERPAGGHSLPVLDLQVPALVALTDPTGRMSTGVLATALDNVGGLSCGLAVLPGWVMTTNLTMRRAPSALTGHQGTGAVSLRAEVLHTGRSAAVARVVTTDAAGVEIATGFLTCAVVAPEGGPPDIDRPVRMTTAALTDDPGEAPRLEEFFGLEPGTAPGEGHLAITPVRRNPWGILYGGGIAVLLEATATSAVSGLPVGTPSPGHVVTDLVIHYLSPGRVGPVVATAERLGRHGRDELVKLEVRDTGADDRPLVTAVTTVRWLSGSR